MSEPLFVPGEIALLAITSTCHCGCVTLRENDEVVIVRILPPEEILGNYNMRYVCYEVNIVSAHGRLGVIEPYLKKKPGNDLTTFDDKIWNPLKEPSNV